MLSIPIIQLICRPRSRAAVPCEMAVNLPMSHICAAKPVKKRRINNSGKELANTVRKAIAEVSSGPATITERCPKRSINQPDGIAAARFPSKNAVTTPLATPKLTPKDFAKVGTAGSAMPVPSPNTSRRQIDREERVPRDRRVSPRHARRRPVRHYCRVVGRRPRSSPTTYSSPPQLRGAVTALRVSLGGHETRSSKKPAPSIVRTELDCKCGTLLPIRFPCHFFGSK